MEIYRNNVCTRTVFVLALCLVVAARDIDYYSWSKPNLPNVEPAAEIVEGKAEFGGHVRSKLWAECGRACQMEKDKASHNIVDIEKELSFETLDVTKQIRTATYLNVTDVPEEMLNSQVNDIESKSNEDLELPILNRKKRSIFGYDTRYTISTERFSTRFPFSTAVKISTGCAGVLISPRHVLTSAHCIHNGKKYLKGVKKLRVGKFYEKLIKKKLNRKKKNLKTRRTKKFKKPKNKKVKVQSRSRRSIRKVKKFRWTRALRTHIPQTWLQTGPRKKTKLMVEYDYAVIELKRNISENFMKLGISPAKEQLLHNRRIHFTAFTQEKPNKLLYRFCPVEEQSKEMMYHYCDAQKGTSGAGIYVRLFDRDASRWNRRIIGVFSGHQWVDMGKDEPPEEYNTGVRITPLKYAQICFWTTGDYSQCRNG